MSGPAGGFPAADVERELNPEVNKDFQVDSVSSDVETNKQIKVINHFIHAVLQLPPRNNKIKIIDIHLIGEKIMHM